MDKALYEKFKYTAENFKLIKWIDKIKQNVKMTLQKNHGIPSMN